MGEIKLEPCANCKGEAKTVHLLKIDKHYIFCKSCGMATPNCTFLADAAKIWNRRS